VWVVASNGAVVFRYPPVEVVHEETFDARPAVRAIMDRHPSVLVAILETHQQADGSVRVPKALQPWLGRDVLEPLAR